MKRKRKGGGDESLQNLKTYPHLHSSPLNASSIRFFPSARKSWSFHIWRRRKSVDLSQSSRLAISLHRNPCFRIASTRSRGMVQGIRPISFPLFSAFRSANRLRSVSTISEYTELRNPPRCELVSIVRVGSESGTTLIPSSLSLLMTAAISSIDRPSRDKSATHIWLTSRLQAR